MGGSTLYPMSRTSRIRFRPQHPVASCRNLPFLQLVGYVQEDRRSVPLSHPRKRVSPLCLLFVE